MNFTECRYPVVMHACISGSSLSPHFYCRPHAGIQPVNARLHGPGHWEDRGLTLLAMVLVVLIAALVFRKLFVFSGWDVQALLSHQ